MERHATSNSNEISSQLKIGDDPRSHNASLKAISEVDHQKHEKQPIKPSLVALISVSQFYFRFTYQIKSTCLFN